MPKIANRVKETTTTTGTGTITLAGAVSAYQTFTSNFANGTVVRYTIAGQTGTEWEVGQGTMVSSTTMSRDTIEASSNSNAAVNLSAGTKDVFVSVTAQATTTRGKTVAAIFPGVI